MNVRQLTLVPALASACIFVSSCSRGAPPPVATNVLDRLLLSPAEINTAIGTTRILANGTYVGMNDKSANIPDKDYRFTIPAEASVYDGSGWIAIRRQDLSDSSRSVTQAVVSLPSANDAARFSARRPSVGRPARCANSTTSTPASPTRFGRWRLLAITNGTLSTTETLKGGSGFACQRALAVSNNVAIDVAVCAVNPAHDSVFNIVDQIAAKVAKQ